jgi:hypothetical protein
MRPPVQVIDHYRLLHETYPLHKIYDNQMDGQITPPTKGANVNRVDVEEERLWNQARRPAFGNASSRRRRSACTRTA